MANDSNPSTSDAQEWLARYRPWQHVVEPALWVLLFCGQATLNSLTVWLDISRIGLGFARWEPVVWEWSSNLVLLALVPRPTAIVVDNNIGGISANSMSSPQGATSDGKFLAIADTGNHRIQIWRTLPTQNQQPADVFLGQLNMATAVVNSGGAATGLSSPVDVFSAGGRLYVADTGNHRVLIWKTIPAQNQQPPDLVLGQADLIGITAYRGGTKPTASTLKSPQGVYADETSIYVSDTGSNRVLIWNTLDPANGQAADVVLGQADFTTDAAAGSVSELAITSPRGLGVTKGRLYAGQYLLAPAARPDRRHVYNQYVVRVPAAHRDALEGGPPEVEEEVVVAVAVEVAGLHRPRARLGRQVDRLEVGQLVIYEHDDLIVRRQGADEVELAVAVHVGHRHPRRRVAGADRLTDRGQWMALDAGSSQGPRPVTAGARCRAQRSNDATTPAR